MNKYAFIFFSGLVGLAIGVGATKALTKTTIIQQAIDPFYDTYTLRVGGQITSVDSKKRVITFKNKRGQTEDLQLSDTITISKLGQIPSLPQISSDIKDLELNKETGAFLQVENGALKVFNLTYIPTIAAPQTPNIPKSSAPAPVPPPPQIPSLPLPTLPPATPIK